MARLTKKAIHAFKGRRAEEEVYGEEPAKLGGKFEATRENIMHAYNWYSQLGEVKDLRKWYEKYVDLNFDDSVSYQIKSLKDIDIPLTLCTISKLYFSGCQLLPEQIEFIEKRTADLASSQVIEKINETTGRSFNKLVAEIDEFLDLFYNSDYKAKPPALYKHLLETAPSPANARFAAAELKALLTEIPDYSLAARAKKNYLAYVEAMIADLETFLQNTTKERKLIRKPRKAKAKSAEQLVKRMKFRAQEPSLKLISVPPASLIGATYAYLYNVKYRKLTYLEGSLTVKGTTIVGFDETKSFAKRLRKPEVQLPEIINSSRLAMLKTFKAIKTKEAAANGRVNSDTVLLKAGK